MSLIISDLARSLQDLGDPRSHRYPGDGSLAQAAGRLTQAYDSYASQAVDLGGNRLAAGNTAAMQATLAAAFVTYQGSSTSAAQLFASAHTAYWTGTAFAAGTPPPPGTPGIVGGNGIFSVLASSVVTAAPPGGLAEGLIALFDAPSTQAGARAQELAALWDQVSRKVVLLMVGLDATPSPAGPLPISATGFVQ